MRDPKRYEFEGQQLTVREIHEIIPALGREAISRRIAAGMTTRQQMLNFDAGAAWRAGGRRGRAACGNKLYWGRK